MLYSTQEGINIPWVDATTLLLIDSSRRVRRGMAELRTAYYPVDIPVCRELSWSADQVC